MGKPRVTISMVMKAGDEPCGGEPWLDMVQAA